jgi:hypothetical protein
MPENEKKEESLEELVSKIEHPNKLLFLEKYPAFAKITETARAIGISQDLVFYWRNHDEPFARAFEEVKKRVRMTRLEELEAEAYKRAKEKSDLLLMFMVKQLDPSYRDKFMEAQLTGDITVKLAIPPYAARVEDIKPLPPDSKKQLPEGEGDNNTT